VLIGVPAGGLEGVSIWMDYVVWGSGSRSDLEKQAA
jgi:hypothetical protein